MRNLRILRNLLAGARFGEDINRVPFMPPTRAGMAKRMRTLRRLRIEGSRQGTAPTFPPAAFPMLPAPRGPRSRPSSPDPRRFGGRAIRPTPADYRPIL